jgi:hypothetical protein
MEACPWYVGYRKETPSKDQIYQILEWMGKPREEVYGGRYTMPMRLEELKYI